ncbi:heme ABC exporter ATP-binding protein CcmA [uncultured Algimonas sp.]|uniref:heme ABC exporter ATP-binding protein CcmA n=1 Tax=uncultured Algimonas sp. TaxID=1547920 RepID=UPI0026374655|nr:heme ABC exporter ATP-binding protein CcmA [uncultured Algimonas sp.]
MPDRFDTLARPISLSVDSLHLSRGDRRLIEGLSLELGPGDALWLTGPNGIGKTTLLLALAGLLRPDAGSVDWMIADHRVRPENAVAYAAHQGPERNGLKLGEELAFWQTLYRDRKVLQARLESVGLSGRADTPVAGLSAGQRRRLSLARLMASNRGAWLMDEPLAGLDTEGRARVTHVLSDHLSNGGLAVIASHQPVPIDGVTAHKLVLEPGS